MNKLGKFTALALASCLSLTLVSCDKEDNNDNNTIALGLLSMAQNVEDPNKKCETTIDASYVAGVYAPLCVPVAGAARFFRLEGVKAAGDNGYFYLFLGYTVTPTSASPTATGNYSFVTGKSVSSPNPYAWFRNAQYGNYQGGQADSGANPTSFSYATDQEICVSFSGTTSAPATYFWVTGVNGANCKVKSTLQKENTIINYSAWPTPGNVITEGGSVYYRFNNTSAFTATKITAYTESVL